MTTSATGQKSVYILPGDPGKETYRLSTYLKFPAIAPVDVIVLARHGFYYTGYKDRVKCFSCGAFIQDWCPQDNPRLARWHLQGCKLVLGTETSNVTIGSHKPEFVGTFTSSMSTSGTGYPSSAASSSENSLPLFPSYPTTSPFLNSPHVPPLYSRGDIRNGEIAFLNRSSPDQKSVYIFPGNPEKETYRLSTYLKFPAIASVDVIELARHGFYYTGYKDRVKCFSCGAFIQDWCPQDNPRLARWHLRGCKLVLGTETSNATIGSHKPEFVGTFTSSLPTSGTGYPSSAASSSENPLPLFPSYPTRSLFLDPRGTRRLGGLHQVRTNYPLSPGGVQSPEIERSSFKNSVDTSQDERAMHKDGEEGSDDNDFPNVEQQPPHSALQHSSQKAGVQENIGTARESFAVHEASNKRKQSKRPGEERLTEACASGERPPKILKRREDFSLSKKSVELKNEQKCKTCFRRQADRVIIPCGHLSLCSECSPSALNCGVCRRKIIVTIKTFLP